MATKPLLLKSRSLGASEPGVLVDVTPASAGWQYIRFTVRRIVPGAVWRGKTQDDECCLVLLSGTCSITWTGHAAITLGPRASVFSSYPHAVYLPTGSSTPSQ